MSTKIEDPIENENLLKSKRVSEIMRTIPDSIDELIEKDLIKINIHIQINNNGEIIERNITLQYGENIPVKDIINDSVANFNSLFEIEKKPIFLKEGGFGYKLIEYDNNIIYNENILNINSKILDKRQKLKNIECRDFILLYDNKDIMFNFERRQKLCYNFCYIY